jgi:hypothetical protein
MRPGSGPRRSAGTATPFDVIRRGFRPPSKAAVSGDISAIDRGEPRALACLYRGTLGGYPRGFRRKMLELHRTCSSSGRSGRLRRGLASELSYLMAIPVAYWTAQHSAVVLFLNFHRNGRERRPAVLHVTYSRTGDSWTADRHFIGIGYDHDPIARPGSQRDLDGQVMVAGDGSERMAHGRAAPRRQVHRAHPGRPGGHPAAGVAFRHLGHLYRPAGPVPHRGARRRRQHPRPPFARPGRLARTAPRGGAGRLNRPGVSGDVSCEVAG